MFGSFFHFFIRHTEKIGSNIWAMLNFCSKIDEHLDQKNMFVLNSSTECNFLLVQKSRRKYKPIFSLCTESMKCYVYFSNMNCILVEFFFAILPIARCILSIRQLFYVYMFEYRYRRIVCYLFVRLFVCFASVCLWGISAKTYLKKKNDKICK